MEKVLNLYAGIGGNRKLWEDVDVTAVEWDEDKAEIYEDNFPNDSVITEDAHDYLLNNFQDFDFIWTSPPCPTHSQMRWIDTKRGQNEPVYPDMDLYEEISLLKHHFEGDYVVENVNPYYEPLIQAQNICRHYFWSNFHIPDFETDSHSIQSHDVEAFESKLGFDLSGYGLKKRAKIKMLRNCVHPTLGEHVYQSRHQQSTIGGFE